MRGCSLFPLCSARVFAEGASRTLAQRRGLGSGPAGARGSPVSRLIRGRFRRLVMKALARQPADRQPTVTAFADELEAAVAQSKDAKSRGWLGTLKNIVGKRDSEQ